MVEIKRILVVQTAFLGDVVLITPLIAALHELYPGATLDALVIPQTAGVLVGNPHLDRILTFDKRKGKLRAFRRAWRDLQIGVYDLAVSAHSSLTTALLLWWARIPRRIGYDRRLTRGLFTDTVPFPRGIHRGEKNLQLLRPLTERKFPLETMVYPSDEERVQAQAIPWPFPNAPRIVIAPASVWPTKVWPAEYYAKLVGELVRQGINVGLIGSKAEHNACEAVIRASGETALNLTGCTITGSAAIIASADLLLCNDSGSLHLGNAVKTPVFAFFGPTVTRFGYYPYRPGDRVFEIDLECRPCRIHGSMRCPRGHHRCMRDLTPEAVFPVVMQYLETLPKDRHANS